MELKSSSSPKFLNQNASIALLQVELVYTLKNLILGILRLLLYVHLYL